MEMTSFFHATYRKSILQMSIFLQIIIDAPAMCEKGKQMIMKTNSEGSILIDYYHGAYGPTLIIIINNKTDMQFFRDIVDSLSKELYQELSTNNRKEFVIRTVKEVLLSLSDNSHSFIDIVDGQIVLCGTKDTWETCGCLIDKLIEGENGHQYLENCFEYSGNIAVELSYMEDIPNTIHGY